MQAISIELDDAVANASAHAMLGFSHHMGGDQGKARIHTDKALALAAEERPTDPGHFAHFHSPYLSLARVLWLQGHVDQAIKACHILGDVPLSDIDPVGSCISLIFIAHVNSWCGDWTAVEERAETLISHAGTHFLVPYRNVGLALRAERLIQRSDLDEGVSLLRRSIARLEADRYRLYTPGFRAALGDGLARSGHVKEAKAELDEAIAAASSLGNVFIVPELLRTLGEVHVREGDMRQAQSLFEQAFAMAERQTALSWQLRSAISMARLAEQGERAATARILLADTYGRFAEGFATADLKAARQLLGAAA
jgi:tetratricopeptide (TPR) repeat protein